MSRQVRRSRFDEAAFTRFLFRAEGKPFDPIQAAQAMIDRFGDMGGVMLAMENLEKFFCSELVAAALEEAGTVGPINASETTPIDLCRWKIYAAACGFHADPAGLKAGTARSEGRPVARAQRGVAALLR